MRDYKLVDWLTQGYLALSAALVLFFHGQELPLWPLYVGGHLAAMVVVHILVRYAQSNVVVRLLRYFYPMILYTVFYSETHVLDNLFYHGYLDGFFIDLDQRLFGCQLSRTLMQRFPYFWVSEIFYIFYFSYLLMVFAVGLALYIKDHRQFFQYITVVSFVFYVCYVVYIFVPVMGPHGADSGVVFRGQLASIGPRVVPEQIQSGPFYGIMGLLYSFAEPESGAAFPSSHVAVAMTTLWFTWSYLKKARLPHLLAVVMLCLSTVYCGYHYAVDVIGGLATAAILVPVGYVLHRKLDRPVVGCAAQA